MDAVSTPHPPRGRPIRVLVVIWAIASLIGLVAALAGLHIDRSGTAAAAEANGRVLWPSGWAALTGVWLLWCRRAAPEAPGRAGRTVALVLGVAVAARGAVLVTHRPALSDDVYRYTFDGRNLAHGINPYLVRPADRIDAEPRWPGEQAVAALINHPALYTIYLPTSQWVFAAAGALIPRAWSGPEAASRVFRAVFIAFDVAVIVLLLAALRRSGRPVWWAALYAWHPLAITEIAGSGHQEPVGIALLVAALLLATPAQRRVWPWTGLLALSTLVKPFVLPAAAFVLKGRRWTAWAACLVTGAVVCAAVSTPLWLAHGAAPLANLLETSDAFRLKWAHFGSVYEPVLWLIESVRPGWEGDRQEVLARHVCLLLAAFIVLGTWWRVTRDPWRAMRIVLTAMVLLSPAAHPWYLLWALAVTPMAFGPAAWVLSLTLPWGYAALAHVTPGGEAAWAVSPWLMAAAYAPVYAVLAADLARRRRQP
jgi:hypothetical protein